jgi:hypothetical protein
VPAGKRSTAAIHFSIDKVLPAEAYRLQIGAKQTQISSLSGPGAFLPNKLFSSNGQQKNQLLQNLFKAIVA